MHNDNFKTIFKGIVGTCVASAAFGGVASAQSNDYTTAGSTVSNTFSLSYTISGTTQTPINNSASPTTFTVDRLVDLTVDYQSNTDDTEVAPGAAEEELVFMLRNDGNDNFAFTLSAVNETNGANEFDTAGLSVRYYVDDNDGSYEPGGDDGAAVTFASATSDLAPDRIIWVEVRGNIPGGQSDGDASKVSLVADTLYPTTWINEAAPSSPGTAIAADDGTNSKDGSADNVLADGTGTSNESANAGDHSDTGTFTVASADLTATKTVTVLSTNLDREFDCGAGTVVSANEYAVAGACLEYVISVVNDGSAAADITAITDTLPDNLRFIDAIFTNFTGGTTAKPSEDTDCDSGACVVSQTGGSVAAGQTASIAMRVLIN